MIHCLLIELNQYLFNLIISRCIKILLLLYLLLYMSESKYIDLNFCLTTQVGGTGIPMPTDGTPMPTDGTPMPTNDGTVHVWGDKVVSMAGDENKGMALERNGTVHVWGYNEFGQRDDIPPGTGMPTYITNNDNGNGTGTPMPTYITNNGNGTGTPMPTYITNNDNDILSTPLATQSIAETSVYDEDDTLESSESSESSVSYGGRPRVSGRCGLGCRKARAADREAKLKNMTEPEREVYIAAEQKANRAAAEREKEEEAKREQRKFERKQAAKQALAAERARAAERAERALAAKASAAAAATNTEEKVVVATPVVEKKSTGWFGWGGNNELLPLVYQL